MRVQTGEADYVNDPTGKITFTLATGVASTHAYWQFNQAIQYRCRFHIQTRGMGSTGTVQNWMVFRDNLGTIIHDVVCNNAASGQLLSLTWPMEFLFIPDPSRSYFLQIEPSTPVQPFGIYFISNCDLFIEEVTNPTPNLYYTNSATPSGLTVQNLNTGSALVGVRDASTSWWIRTSGTSLVFERESAPGSGVWSVRSTIN